MINNINDMQKFAADARARGETLGLVPTMGALHEGHLSLIRRAASENSITIVSIFINPAQFDDPGDFSAYPSALHTDIDAAVSAGADVVFAPSAADMYPDGFSTYIDMSGVSEQLCGASRPSYFRGMLTVVAKLFGICRPDNAYFGEKDAQQLAAISKMVNELNVPVTIIGCPTVREEDGLAMSSRNVRLTTGERIAARCLYRSLNEIRARFDDGECDPEALKALIREILGSEPLIRIDYVEIVDPMTFDSVVTVSSGDLACLAVYLGNTRLIDNQRF